MMPPENGSWALVVGLTFAASACALAACALETSGLDRPGAASAGSGGGGASPTTSGIMTTGETSGEGDAGGATSSGAAVSSSASSASSGGGMAEDLCGPGSTLELKDDFDNDQRNTALWSAYNDMDVEVQETGMQVVVRTDKDGGRGGYVSKSPRSLHDCHAHIEVNQVVNSDDKANAVVFFRLYGNSGMPRLEFRQQGSDLYFGSTINGEVQEEHSPYSTTTHRWWRFRESSGTITWDTSLDGHDWQPRRTLATNLFGSVTALKVDFGAIGGTQNTNEAHFDNMNVTP